MSSCCRAETLREPPRNPRRASYIFVTKSTGDKPGAYRSDRRYNRTAEIIECTHKPLYLQNIVTGERIAARNLKGAFIGSICGIAAPESFEGGLRNLGARIEVGVHFIVTITLHRARDAEVHEVAAFAGTSK